MATPCTHPNRRETSNEHAQLGLDNLGAISYHMKFCVSPFFSVKNADKPLPLYTKGIPKCIHRSTNHNFLTVSAFPGVINQQKCQN